MISLADGTLADSHTVYSDTTVPSSMTKLRKAKEADEFRKKSLYLTRQITKFYLDVRERGELMGDRVLYLDQEIKVRDYSYRPKENASLL